MRPCSIWMAVTLSLAPVIGLAQGVISGWVNTAPFEAPSFKDCDNKVYEIDPVQKVQEILMAAEQRGGGYFAYQGGVRTAYVTAEYQTCATHRRCISLKKFELHTFKEAGKICGRP